MIHVPHMDRSTKLLKAYTWLLHLFLFVCRFLQRVFLKHYRNLYHFPSVEKLWVTDLRTFRHYIIPIKNSTIQATDLGKISLSTSIPRGQKPIGRGLLLLDPGFRNTAVKESQITYIDGARGTLQYRQYPIDYLVTQHDYEDVAYLLLWGRLPTPAMKTKFRAKICEHMLPNEAVIQTIRYFRPEAPAFLMIAAGLSAWAAANPETVPTYLGRSVYDNDERAVDEGIYRTLAAFATVVAITYCHQQGRSLVLKTDPALSSIENMLLMMGRVDCDGTPDKQANYALNKLWILFADHELTNSTAAFLNATSSLSDPISACVASVASGNGPLHGGAIDLVYKHLAQIRGKEGVRSHIENVRQKKCRLMGVGHRMYRTVDPRIPHVRSLLQVLSTETPQNSLLEVALEIDRIVAEDSYFTSRKLSVNADLYGSFVYAALGFDPKIFTSLSMTARCAGVLAHWRESRSQPTSLWRPQQVFTGNVVV